jgi:asparagine synthase (glutamine-hydrolysing)
MLSKLMLPFSGLLPQSRKSSFGNLNRRLVKLARQAAQRPQDRYFEMCKISSEAQVRSLLSVEVLESIQIKTNEFLASEIGLRKSPENLNQCLFNDMKLVLSNDMLMKADHSSMANSLEVRVPFLDHELVDFVFSLPSDWKANTKRRKQILVDAFEDFLPKSILNRPKHGFEVPLQKWLKNDLKSEVEKYVFNRERIKEMRLLDWKSVELLRNQMNSGNPGDSPARVWALYHLMKKLESN